MRKTTSPPTKLESNLPIVREGRFIRRPSMPEGWVVGQYMKADTPHLFYQEYEKEPVVYAPWQPNPTDILADDWEEFVPAQ